MILKSDAIKDKVEFFEAKDLQQLEAQIQKKIEMNADLLLEVQHVHYQVVTNPVNGRTHATGMVHFKQPENS
ncbi:DUF2536 family protein [Alkalicoccus daliensis]|uniref:DUF2536 family protein n=1 Tax=Alkalicoccus daliensis TaxID=745820 RepID=A0A1H0BI27_9BACI|nr:DUF2536 family protein [Alkalicoccus daliensis]SDN45296.1 Protein of unknown function [Alkalicoccus daliensis]